MGRPMPSYCYVEVKPYHLAANNVRVISQDTGQVVFVYTISHRYRDDVFEAWALYDTGLVCCEVIRLDHNTSSCISD